MSDVHIAIAEGLAKGYGYDCKVVHFGTNDIKADSFVFNWHIEEDYYSRPVAIWSGKIYLDWSIKQFTMAEISPATYFELSDPDLIELVETELDNTPASDVSVSHCVQGSSKLFLPYIYRLKPS
ncbi:MAG: hypothetical protein HN975_02120 [Anaerolineae bacterium]|jgi:hypothetical protein|nr:hypothetical protein [Anaerolineae bacterium]